MTETSAQVVLRSGEASAAEQVVAWFRNRGFETGPLVGISFAVSGGESLFREVFGDAVGTSGGGEVELPMSSLADDVAPYVAAVVQTAPPDFGPGNP